LKANVLLPLINEAVKQILTAKEPTRVCWNQVAQTILPKVSDPTLSEYLKDESRARYLKIMYLNQIQWDSRWDDQIKAKLQSKKSLTNEDWVGFYPNEDLKVHTPFILFQNYQRRYGIKQRYRVHSVELFPGVTMPIPPTIKSTTEELKKEYLGGLSVGEEDPTAKFTDQQFWDKLCEGYIYIGQLLAKDVPINEKWALPLKHTTHARMLNLRWVLLSHIHRLYKEKLLKGSSSQRLVVNFSDWFDGTSVLNTGLLVWTIMLNYDSKLLVDDAPYSRVTKALPWFIGFLHETCNNMEDIRRELGRHICNFLKDDVHLVLSPGCTITVQFKFTHDRCDNASGQKAHGSSCGGHKRCSICGKDFSVPTELYQYCESVQAFQKTLQNQIDAQKSDQLKDTLKAAGQKKPDPILDGDFTTPLQDRGLDEAVIAPDALHNVVGSIKTLVYYEQSKEGWSEPLFQVLLYKELKQTSMDLTIPCNN
jgi:hypothetical protein